jgi:uncharacterized protein
MNEGTLEYNGKLFIRDEALRDLTYQLGKKVLDSGFRPNLLVGLWRGAGGMTHRMHEQFERYGLDVKATMVETVGYDDQQIRNEIKVDEDDLRKVLTKIKGGRNKVLFLDDVCDTGNTLKTLLDELNFELGAVKYTKRIATGFYKPLKNKSGIRPNHHIIETNKWIVFPHTLEGLTDEEIRNGKGLDPEVL